MRYKLLLIMLMGCAFALLASRADKSFATPFDEEATDGTATEAASGSADGSSTRQLPAHGGGGAGGPGHSMIEIYLSLGVLVFGMVIMLAEIYVTVHTGHYWDTWSFKIIGLTFVLVSGLFLIVAGYSEDQTAPMMGLLGTVAGYLLGKDEKPEALEAPGTFEEEE